MDNIMEWQTREQVEVYLRSTENREKSNYNTKLTKVVEVTRYFIKQSRKSSLYTSAEEINDILATFDNLLKNHRKLDKKSIREMSVLFAPTGPIQEISIDGGWSKIFFLLAKTVDETLRI